MAVINSTPRDQACGHYTDVIMGTKAYQITSLTIVYSTVYSDADQREYQSSASLAFVRGIHRRPVSSPHKWPVTRKMFPFDDVIMHWFEASLVEIIPGTLSLEINTKPKMMRPFWWHFHHWLHWKLSNWKQLSIQLVTNISPKMTFSV